MFNAKKVRGLVKAYVRCPYCNKANSHGSDKVGYVLRACDGCKRDYRVNF